MILPDTLAGARLFQQTKKIPRIPSSSFLPSGAATGRRFQTSPARRAPCGGETKHTTPGAPLSIPGRFFFQKKSLFFSAAGAPRTPHGRSSPDSRPAPAPRGGGTCHPPRTAKQGRHTPRPRNVPCVAATRTPQPRHGPAFNASPQHTGRSAACVPRYSRTEFHRHQAPRPA